MSPPLPPIYRDCRRLLVHTEEAVRRFARYHKYTVGADLRRQAMAVMRAVHHAVFDKPRQLEHIEALIWRVDDYKFTLQLAMEVGAFTHGAKGTPSFAAFETAVNLAAGIGVGAASRPRCAGRRKGGPLAQAEHASRSRATVEPGEARHG